MVQKQTLVNILIPLFYTAAILALVFYQWNEQMIVWQGGSSPLYRNLMDYPAYIRHGFDIEEIMDIEDGGAWLPGETWHSFTSAQLRIRNSPLPNLPQRSFLSPWKLPAEEFTILIPIELDNTALASGTEPGIFLGYIGENWEIYFNGHLVQREMHLNETGQITSRRSWRGVHFPMDGSLLYEGTNTLAFRIIGDPSYGVTGLYYSSPYYIDDYNIIKRRHLNILEMALCGIFGYTSIYYLIIFLSVRKKKELYNLYYSIASIFLSIYTLMFSGIVNYIIPNSDISIRLEYISLFMLVPMLGLFIEHFVTQKITKISWGFLAFYGVLSLTQIFFSAQYGDDVLMIWSATVLIYFSYIFFYNMTRYIRRGRKEENADSFIANILIGLVVVYLCGIYDVVDIIFFHNSSSLFLYSTFIFHIGMAITLSQRFRGMYRQLERSNIILEEQVYERTLELKEQTVIAQEASQAALEASAAKSNFLAIMSHEIRTPLNAVIGFSEIELRENHRPESRENIGHIHRSGSFLLGIINEILDISKIESGKLELLPDEYETAPLISGTVGLNRIRIGEKPIQFILEINAGFPSRLIGDELRVRQILNNLLSNAIKYTHEGTIKLTVSKDKDNKIIFTVRDTGIGIRPENMDRLFENYMQLDAQANRRSEGTGLGLAITKNLTEMMGGGISIESEYGKGSVFTAWIMQEQKDPDIIGEDTAAALRNFSYALDRKEMPLTPINIPDGRVLIVDDIPENLLVARGLLKPYGLVIDTAGSGHEAIELVKHNDYRLIFLDHMMPEMDGIETLKAIRTLGSQTPIIAMTAHTLKGMNEFYLEQGFEDFLSKPIRPQDLDDILMNWILNQESNSKPPSTALLDGTQIMHSFDAANFSSELDKQKLDRLNHFCFAFESGREIDIEYLKSFTACIESLNTANFSGNVPEQANLLVRAALNQDTKTIRKILPGFYEAMKEQLTANREPETGEKDLHEILLLIKEALIAGDYASAGKKVKELGTMSLNQQERDLYFTLYDLLMEDKTEQALEAIEEYLSQKEEINE